MNLSTAVKFSLVEPVAAAGQTTLTSDAIDMRGFTSVCILVPIGSVTATGTAVVKLQQSSDDGSTDAYSDILGSGMAVTDADGNKLLVSDLIYPSKRYIRALITRSTADSVFGGIIAAQYLPDKEPISAHASVLTTEMHGPGKPEGTA
jgi:hypothetical protein